MKHPRTLVAYAHPLILAVAVIGVVSIVGGAVAAAFAMNQTSKAVPTHVVAHAKSASIPTVVKTATPAPTPTVQPTTPTAASKSVTVTPAAAAQAVAAVTSAPSSTVSTLTPSTDTSTPAPSTTPPTPAPTPTTPSVPTPAAHYSSTNWSGYMATSGTFTGVSGAWTVPTPTSTSTTSESLDAAWIGIGGVSTQDLIQTGTTDIVAPDGTVTASAFYELLPANAMFISSMSVNPGDAMSALITQSTPNTWALTINDITDGQSFSTTLSYTSSLSSAEWIEEDPSYGDGTLTSLDNFGTVNFTDNRADVGSGLQLADAFNPASITLINSHRRVVATPSAMSNGAFSVAHS